MRTPLPLPAWPAWIAVALLGASSGAAPQSPPTPLPSPIAPQPGAASPEDTEWAAAMEQKRLAGGNAEKAMEAVAAFTAFQAKYPGSARATEAAIEKGVCFMLAGLARQQWHRNRPEGVEAFKKAIECFLDVPKQRADSPFAARAWYCAGLAWIQLDELAKAEQCLTTAIELQPRDRAYFGKALEKRATVRRCRLETAAALADLQRYKQEFGPENADPAKQTEEYKYVLRHESYLRAMQRPAPELRAETWPGGEATSLAQMKGEVVALYFWAHWCHNCENEASFIREMSERWGPLGVRFVGVTDFSAAGGGPPAGPNPKDPAETQRAIDVVKAYLAKHAFTFPVMMDRGPTAQAYLARTYPEVVLLDREGKIRWHDHPKNLLDSTFETVLFGKPEDDGPAKTDTTGSAPPPPIVPGGK
jgi:thiol-disulfide isomerase/thioredoxin